MDIGSLVAYLGLDIRDLKKGVSEAKKDMSSFSNVGKKELDKVSQAWKTLGNKSGQDIKKMEIEVKRAYRTIRMSSTSTIKDIERAEIASKARLAKINDDYYKKQKRQLEDYKKSAKGVSGLGAGASGISSMLGPIGKVIGAYIILRETIQKVIAVTKELVNAGIRLQALENAFVAITGTAASARIEMEFISDTANRLGLNLKALETSYKTLAAASMNTALEGKGARDVFVAVSEASTAMQLSATQSHAALYALQQMMSKGRVQTEELRRQLGEQLPGAFQMAAEAMGVSQMELNKMLELGQVMSEDFLPKFAKVLHEKFGRAAERNAELARGAFNRFGTAVEQLKRTLAESGLIEFMADLARVSTKIIRVIDKGLTPTIEDLEKKLERLEAASKKGSEFYNPKMAEELKKAIAEVNEELETLREVARVKEVTEMNKGVDAAVVSYKKLQSALQEIEDFEAAVPFEEFIKDVDLSKVKSEISNTLEAWFSGLEEMESGLKETEMERVKAVKRVKDEYNKLTLSVEEYQRLKVYEWYDKEKEALGGVTKELREVLRLKLAIINVPTPETIAAETSAGFAKEEHQKKFEDMKKISDVNYEEINNVWEEKEKERLKKVEEFNQRYNELTKSKYDIEREELTKYVKDMEAAKVDGEKLQIFYAKRSEEIARAENAAKLMIYENAAGSIANTFMQIAQAGGKQSKEAFMAYKAFAIAEATISGHRAVVNALASTAPWPMPQILAGIAAASTAAQIAMIASAQPPSYDSGGISNARGVYQTGNIQEAHVPIPSGKIPVELGEQKQEETPLQLTVLNTISPEVLDEWAGSSRGRNVIMNSLGREPKRFRRMINR